MLAGRNIGLLVGVMTMEGMYLLILINFKNCQKVVKKWSKKCQKNCQKIVKKIVKKLVKTCQKLVKLIVKKADDQETIMLAGRNIGLLVGVMTMGGMYLLIPINFKNCQKVVKSGQKNVKKLSKIANNTDDQETVLETVMLVGRNIGLLVGGMYFR